MSEIKKPDSNEIIKPPQESEKKSTPEIGDIVKEGEHNITQATGEIANNNQNILQNIEKNPNATAENIADIKQIVAETNQEISGVAKEKDIKLTELGLEQPEANEEENKDITEINNLLNQELTKINELKKVLTEVKNINNKTAKEKKIILLEKITAIEGTDQAIALRRLSRKETTSEGLSAERSKATQKINSVDRLLTKQPDSSLQEKNNVLKDKLNESFLEKYQINAELDPLLKKINLDLEKEQTNTPTENESKRFSKEDQRIKDIEDIQNIETADMAKEKIDKIMNTIDKNNTLDTTHMKELPQRILMKFVANKKPMEALKLFDYIINKDKNITSVIMVEAVKNILDQIKKINPDRYDMINDRIKSKIEFDNYDDMIGNLPVGITK